MLLVTMCTFMSVAQAAQNIALPVNWNQGAINWNQLQSLFNQNPGYNQFNIHFPNGYTWNADVNQVNSLYSTYANHAQSIGYKGNVPPLSFSSLSGKNSISGNGATISLNRISQDMASATQNLMNELDYQKYALASYLPDWLKKLIVMACDGFMVLYDFALQQIQQWIG